MDERFLERESQEPGRIPRNWCPPGQAHSRLCGGIIPAGKKDSWESQEEFIGTRTLLRFFLFTSSYGLYGSNQLSGYVELGYKGFDLIHTDNLWTSHRESDPEI